jgi:hypothetical protein
MNRRYTFTSVGSYCDILLDQFQVLILECLITNIFTLSDNICNIILANIIRTNRKCKRSFGSNLGYLVYRLYPCIVL